MKKIFQAQQQQKARRHYQVFRHNSNACSNSRNSYLDHPLYRGNLRDNSKRLHNIYNDDKFEKSRQDRFCHKDCSTEMLSTNNRSPLKDYLASHNNSTININNNNSNKLSISHGCNLHLQISSMVHKIPLWKCRFLKKSYFRYFFFHSFQRTRSYHSLHSKSSVSSH